MCSESSDNLKLKINLHRFTKRQAILHSVTLISLFTCSFCIGMLPYLLGKSTLPLGWDIAIYLNRMNELQNGRLTTDIRRSYITLGVIVHILSGMDFFQVEKILPILISSFVPVLFYVIQFLLRGSWSSSSLCGWLAIFSYSRLRMLEDLHDSQFAFVLFLVLVVMVLVQIKKYSLQESKEVINTNLRRNKISIVAIILILTLIAFSLPEMYVFSLLTLWLSLIVLKFHVRFKISKGQSTFKFMNKLFLITSITSLILFLSLGSPYIISWATSYIPSTRMGGLSAEYYEEFMRRYYSSSSYPALSMENLAQYLWGNETYVGAWLLLFFLLGIILILQLAFFSKNSFQISANTLIFVWLTIPLVSSFIAPLANDAMISRGVWIPEPERLILILPAPVAASIGIELGFRRLFAVKKTLLSTGGFCSIFLLVTLILIPQSMIGIDMRLHTPLNINAELITQLEDLKMSLNEEDFPIFVVRDIPPAGARSILKCTLNVILNRPYSLYFGRLRFLAQPSYTPDLDNFVNLTSLWLWQDLCAEIESNAALTPKFYALRSLYELNEIEKSWLEKVDDDIFFLNLSRAQDNPTFGMIHAIFDTVETVNAYGISADWALDGRALEHYSQEGDRTFSSTYLVVVHPEKEYELLIHMIDNHPAGRAPLLVKLGDELIWTPNYTGTGTPKTFVMRFKPKHSGPQKLTIEMIEPNKEHYLTIDWLNLRPLET